MRLPLRTCLAALAAAAALPAFAQDNIMGMPDGSHDLTGSLIAVSTARSEGSRRRQFAVLPGANARWSNGLFAQMGQVGWNVADGDPTISYGPLAVLNLVQRRADDPSDKTTLGIEGGAFASWGFAQTISFTAATLYGGGPDRRGLSAIVETNLTPFFGSHYSITFSPQLVWANASYMKSAFGIDAAQSARDGLPLHDTHAGLKTVAMDARWDWQVTNKVSLTTNVILNHLVGSAGASPLVERRNDATVMLAFNWHF